MGHITEPEGIDFIIQSDPLTDEERKAISDFIRKDKAKLAAKRNLTKRTKPKKGKTDSNIGKSTSANKTFTSGGFTGEAN